MEEITKLIMDSNIIIIIYFLKRYNTNYLFGFWPADGAIAILPLCRALVGTWGPFVCCFSYIWKTSDDRERTKFTKWYFKKQMWKAKKLWIWRDKHASPVMACSQDKVAEVCLGGLAGIWVLQKAGSCFWGPEKLKVLMVVEEPAFAFAQISREVEL